MVLFDAVQGQWLEPPCKLMNQLWHSSCTLFSPGKWNYPTLQPTRLRFSSSMWHSLPSPALKKDFFGGCVRNLDQDLFWMCGFSGSVTVFEFWLEVETGLIICAVLICEGLPASRQLNWPAYKRAALCYGTLQLQNCCMQAIKVMLLEENQAWSYLLTYFWQLNLGNSLMQPVP